MSDKTTLFGDAREALIAATTDTRKVFRTTLPDGKEWWGLSATSHQFKTAIADMVCGDVKPLTKEEIHRALVEQLRSIDQSKTEAGHANGDGETAHRH